MDTLKSLTDIQNQLTIEVFEHDKKYNHVRTELDTKRTGLFILWKDAFTNRDLLSYEHEKELAYYAGALYERIESGELKKDYQIEACLNILKLKYLRYLEYSQNKTNQLNYSPYGTINT